MRPLASLSHAIDFTLWPHAVAWMHVESAAIFGVVVWLAGAIFRRLALPTAALGLATFFYAMCGNHSMSVAWLAGRNTVLATALGLLALHLQLKAWHEAPGAPSDPGRRRAWMLASAAALGCGLLCAEFALGAAGFLLAHALTFDERRLSQRLLSLWPHALVLAAWQVFYIAGGYGVSGSDFYHGPSQEPAAFAFGVMTGLPIYLASQLTWPFATLSIFFPGGLAITALLSLVLLYSMRRLFMPLIRSDGRARFFVLGAALATVPLGASVPQDRLVFFVGFGTSGLLALLVTQRLDRTNRELPRFGARRLFNIHGIVLPLLFVPMQFSTATANAVGGGATALANVLAAGSGRGAIVLNAPSSLVGAFQNLMRTREGMAPLPFVDILYAGAQPVHVRRPAAGVLELEVERGYLAVPIERIFRNPARAPFRKGDQVSLSRMRVTIAEVDANAAPTRVRFEFPQNLEQLPIDWFVWEGKQPIPWKPPPLGGELKLPALRAFP
jgi:hypothetical protein